jgi:hypothetical protein
MLPSAWGEGVGIAMMGDFGADLRGLLPRCVRFAPTSHPVNGNTRYWPVCLTLARRDLHPLDCNRRFPLFIGSSSSKLFRTRHPEPLTDPDVNLSIHPARATLEGCHLPPPSTSSSGCPLTLCDGHASGLLPSLHGHYSASTLLLSSATLASASVLSASREGCEVVLGECALLFSGCGGQSRSRSG